VIDARTTDRLPPYRAAGGLVATGALLVRGGSVMIRERFCMRVLERNRVLEVHAR